MKRKAPPALIWSGSHYTYFWQDAEWTDDPLWYRDAELWFRWLSAHHSFSFQGQHGHLNLLKEARLRGEEGYWYAYRSQGKRPTKKYAGRSAALTIERLEGIAWRLTHETAIDSGMLKQNNPTSERRKASVQNERETVSLAHFDSSIAPTREQQQMSFLLPKLQLPPLPPFLVQRERLLTLFDTALHVPFTLLISPPGFGKTTLVRQWMIERATHMDSFPQVAWVSLEAADNDLARFWNYVLTACQFSQEAHTGFLRDTQPFVKPAVLEEVLTIFLNALVHVPGEVILVLENYQAITLPQIHESITFFLDHLPVNVHLIMLTRSEPPVPVAQLRASGKLCEVTGRDLRFSAEEVSKFLQQVISWPLSEQMLRDINARLQGWVAGLRLLSFTLQRFEKPQDGESLLVLLDGGRPPFLEYFVSEVFLLQPQPLQDFLLQTCLLGNLNSSLCDALLGGNESAMRLNTLERTNLYLERFESPQPDLSEVQPQWYRYHPLFVEALRHLALLRFGTEQLCTWAEQASRWYVQHHLLPDAIETSLAVGESTRAAAFTEQFMQLQHIQVSARSLQYIQQTHRLRYWLAALPSDLIRRRPLLALGQAEVLLFTSILDQQPFLPQYRTQIEEMLHLAEEHFRAQGELIWLKRLLFTRTLIERYTGNITQAASYVRQQGSDSVSTLSSGLNMHVLGTEALLTGQVEKAIQIFLEARGLYEQLDSPPIMRSNSVLLGRTYFEHGEVYLAAEYFRQILASARPEQDFDDIGDAQLGLARISYEWNQLADAEQQALEAFELGERLANEELCVQASLMLARVEQVQGQSVQAQQRCWTLLTRYPSASSTVGLSLSHRLHLEIQATLAWLWLKSGNLSAVEQWANQRQPTYDGWLAQSEQEDLLVVRLLLAQEKIEAAHEICIRVAASADANQRQRIALQAHLLLSLVDASSKRLSEARKHLRFVVAQVCSQGYIRLFLDEGESMQSLLQALVPTLREETQRTYLRHLLLAFVQGRASEAASDQIVLTEPLSHQEQRVLQRLGTGQTNQEIANELVVSVNTVRTQVRSIYQKLNVKNRVEASELAHQLKLL